MGEEETFVCFSSKDGDEKPLFHVCFVGMEGRELCPACLLAPWRVSSSLLRARLKAKMLGEDIIHFADFLDICQYC